MSKERNSNKKDHLPKQPWYIHPLIVIIVVAFSIIVSDPILFILSLILLGARFKSDKAIKKNLCESVEKLTELNCNLECENNELRTKINAEKKISELEDKIKFTYIEYRELTHKINLASKELNEMLEKINLASEINTYHSLEKELSVLQVGLLKKEYSFDISEEYKEEIKKIQQQQSECIKSHNATSIKIPDFLKNDDKKVCNKVLSTSSKILLRAFNNECDAVLAKVNHKNIENSRKRIEASFNQINKLGDYFGVVITLEYLKLKIKEIQLTFEYEVKKQEELEEQRSIKEQMREEAKVQAEINKLEKEALKEEELYKKVLAKARLDLEASSENEKAVLIEKIKKLEYNLHMAEEKMQRAKSMAEQTKSGFVYIISNVGSFGENIYKIGMTRRIDPQERINELSSASVPFPFDVHATIYTHNAPELENKLHQAFDHKRVNKVNNRKEFFNISLDEIVDKVNEIHGEIKLTKQAEAYQYRQSIVNTVG